MSSMGELIELQIEEVNNARPLEDLHSKLPAGTVLVVENWEDEKLSLRIVERALKSVEEEPVEFAAGLIEKDGILVYRGEIPQGFDLGSIHARRARSSPPSF